MSDAIIALRQVEYEQKSFWRNPVAAIFAFLFPIIFLVVFATIFKDTSTRVNGVANVSAPDPRMVLVQPWDPKMLGVIEKAILKSDLGINPSNDGQVIRLVLPQLTQDRRKELVKQVHQRAEEARVAVRNCRRDALEHLRKAEKEDDSGISMEDEKRAQERLQKLTDQFVKRIEEVSRRKETEVTEV